jgi:aspartate racemase
MNCNGKILGVLGGMGPLATADFLRLLAENAPANMDQEHSKIYVLSNPQIPDRTKGIFGMGESPEPYLKMGLETLIEWGADFLAVPCNTSHFFIDKFEDSITDRLIHIVKETLSEASKIAPNGAWLNATQGAVACELYQKYAKKMDYSLYVPNDQEQSLVNQVIFDVKANHIDRASVVYENLIETLFNTKCCPIVCACTELPIAYRFTRFANEKMVSSLSALVNGCIKRLY